MRAVLIGLTVGAIFGQAPLSQRETPPEVREIQEASRIADAAVRLLAFEKIKATYPQSPQMTRIDGLILEARIDLAGTVEAVVNLQKRASGFGQGPRPWVGYYDAAARILDHPKLNAFAKNRVLAAVEAYRAGAAKTAPPGNADADFYLRSFDLLMARAQANAGDGKSALAALERFKAAGGESQAEYFNALGDAYAALGRSEDATGAYLGAALDRSPGATDKARAMYLKTHGSAQGFEERLETLFKALPFTPEAFKPPPDWKGKAVLAELFTGTGTPSSLGADLAFAGLIRAVPPQYLAVLEYHLSLQGPDPMMNPAARRRQDYYGIRRVPTAIIDGEMTFIGGGARRMSAAIFKQYKAAVDARVPAKPEVQLAAEAVRYGDTVRVDFKIKKYLPSAVAFAVLVQNEETYKGPNGTIVHRFVVRDIVEHDPAASGKAAFDLAAAEKAQTPIDREGLRVVVFVQDKETKRVLNAVVADVK